METAVHPVKASPIIEAKLLVDGFELHGRNQAAYPKHTPRHSTGCRDAAPGARRIYKTRIQERCSHQNDIAQSSMQEIPNFSIRCCTHDIAVQSCGFLIRMASWICKT